jgi:prephenate dehydrogenase
MSVQITIIGLGQIGASFGLALASQKEQIVRVGHDKDTNVAKQAKQIGAVDRIENNLHASVRDADVVLLALPMDQLRETLEWIGPDLREGAVVLDTAPDKEIVAGWVKEYLPPERYYIGLTPVLNPDYLHNVDTGIGAAHADLFQGGLFAIVSPTETRSDAIKLASDLARLLGAAPLFADTAEMDGLMAATHLLPQLLAAVLLDATIDQPGWQEGRKIAGKAYAEVSGAMTLPTTPESLASALIYNRDNTLRLLEKAIDSLQALRSELQKQDEKALADRFARNQLGREIWWGQRRVSDWAKAELAGDVEIPKASEVFAGLFGFRRKSKNK